MNNYIYFFYNLLYNFFNNLNKNISSEIYWYIFILTLLILLIYYFYICLRLDFWKKLPIINIYNSFLKDKNKLINTNLPEINKYCDFINIHTYNFNDFININKNQNKYFENIIKNNENIFNITPKQSFISIEFNKEQIYNNKFNKFITQNSVINCIYSIPINLTYLKKSKKINYLLDNIDLNKSTRNLLFTHIYNICHINKIHEILLFKSNINIKVLKPLIIVNKYKIKIKNIINDKNPKLFYNFLKINKQNISLLTQFIHENNNKFDIFILYNLHDILNLLINKKIYIYSLYFDNNIRSLYIFKFIKNNLTLISSFNNCNNNIFYYGFLKSLENIQKISNNINLIINILNISHNEIILKYYNSNIQLLEDKIYYYIYNYKMETIINNRFFTFI